MTNRGGIAHTNASDFGDERVVLVEPRVASAALEIRVFQEGPEFHRAQVKRFGRVHVPFHECPASLCTILRLHRIAVTNNRRGVIQNRP